ncbi:unnamed protein product [Vitrella brassicaformis CCMP3155]|uniref:Uncharacterized protein n=1 Tax=Vitrella brassicaformis (strain CCMP3155) TaxID=1169540 RepID=A0A0G4EYF2_VITBC|nr:unnamed protein product [Vitrella brassicaformis CCMP3155]|eukprot:CEM03475.1 unnamed protein product [Vitrella brassicaformis CCMP3155]
MTLDGHLQADRRLIDKNQDHSWPGAETVRNDADERQVRQTLEVMGAYHRGLRPHRVMFCGSTAGRASMVRQLQPMTHIESNPEILSAVKGKVPNVVHVGSVDEPRSAAAAAGAPSPDFSSLADCLEVLKAVVAS